MSELPTVYGDFSVILTTPKERFISYDRKPAGYINCMGNSGSWKRITNVCFVIIYEHFYDPVSHSMFIEMKLRNLRRYLHDYQWCCQRKRDRTSNSSTVCLTLEMPEEADRGVEVRNPQRSTLWLSNLAWRKPAAVIGYGLQVYGPWPKAFLSSNVTHTLLLKMGRKCCL